MSSYHRLSLAERTETATRGDVERLEEQLRHQEQMLRERLQALQDRTHLFEARLYQWFEPGSAKRELPADAGPASWPRVADAADELRTARRGAQSRREWRRFWIGLALFNVIVYGCLAVAAIVTAG